MSALTTLPVRMEFRLPDGWYAAEQAGALFVAKNPMSAFGADSFVANITISGYRRDDGHMGDIADESVARLARTGEVRVLDRREVGSRRARGCTQLLALSIVHDGQSLELVQQQVYLSLRDVEEAGKRAILQVAMTCTPRQFGQLAGEFSAFVRTVRPS